jgi:hypothetical protein
MQISLSPDKANLKLSKKENQDIEAYFHSSKDYQTLNVTQNLAKNFADVYLE